MPPTHLEPYPAYKDSGVPWLGNVPAHWNLSHGRAAFREKKVKNTGMIERQVLSLSYGRIVVKPPEKLHGLVPESFETYQVVDPNDIIVRSTDLQNDWNSLRIGLVKDRGIITSAYICLNVNGSLTPEYAHLLLHSYDLMKIYYGMGSGLRQNLDITDFKYLPIPVPPPAEQHAIAHFLDHFDRRVNRSLRAKRQLSPLLNEQKQAIIHRAVTRGLDPTVPLKPSGITWLGDIPRHWEVRRAKQVCSAIVDCKNRTPALVDGGECVVVRTTNIRHARFNQKGSYTTDRRNYEIWTQRGAPRVGDVFFTREAPVGEACLVPPIGNLCMGQRMMYFRPNTAVLDPEFLLHSIYGPVVRRYIEIEANGSTVGHLRLGQVSALPLLWCPIEDQRRIVAHVAIASEPLSKAIARLERENDLLREYRTRLVAAVVTGKLDVRVAATRLSDEAPLDSIEDVADLGDEAETADDEVAV